MQTDGMQNLDGKILKELRQWRCCKNKDHVLGVTERVKVTRRINGKALSHYSTRLLVFRHAVDLSANVPDEIEICGLVDGATLSMTWKCSVIGCGAIKEWLPQKGAIERLASTYLSE